MARIYNIIIALHHVLLFCYATPRESLAQYYAEHGERVPKARRTAPINATLPGGLFTNYSSPQGNAAAEGSNLVNTHTGSASSVSSVMMSNTPSEHLTITAPGTASNGGLAPSHPAVSSNSSTRVVPGIPTNTPFSSGSINASFVTVTSLSLSGTRPNASNTLPHVPTASATIQGTGIFPIHSERNSSSISIRGTISNPAKAAGSTNSASLSNSTRAAVPIPSASVTNSANHSLSLAGSSQTISKTANETGFSYSASASNSTRTAAPIPEASDTASANSSIPNARFSNSISNSANATGSFNPPLPSNSTGLVVSIPAASATNRANSSAPLAGSTHTISNSANATGFSNSASPSNSTAIAVSIPKASITASANSSASLIGSTNTISNSANATGFSNSAPPSNSTANAPSIPAVSATHSANSSSPVAGLASTDSLANNSSTNSHAPSVTGFIPGSVNASETGSAASTQSGTSGISGRSSSYSASSTNSAGGSSSGGGVPGPIVPVGIPGGLGVGGGLGGIGGVPGGGGEGDGDGNNDNKPSISNPSLSNSQPSRTPTSSASQTSFSSSGSVTTSSQSSSSASSTSSSSSSMNTTSIASSSTISQSTNSSTVASSTATGIYCSVGACNGPQCSAPAVPGGKRDTLSLGGRLATPKDFLRRELEERNVTESSADHDLWKRGYIPMLTDPDFANNINNFITEQITYPGAKPCPLPTFNPDSTAVTVKFDSPPEDGNYFPSLQGLEGCTSVVIIGENGCWISHFWEAPWFLGYSARPDAFTQNVITPLENGNGANMPSPFGPGGQSERIPELAAGQNNFEPEIRIFTRMDNGAITYPAQVALLEQALTGPGRAFAGVPVTTTGYVRQEPDSRIAKGKILVQYTNDQEDDEGNQLVCPQQAIYKLWFEDNLISQHTWSATGDQLEVPKVKAKLRRRQECASNSTISTTSKFPSSAIASVPSVASFVTLSSGANPTSPVATYSGLALVSSGSIKPNLYRPSVPANSIIWATAIPQSFSNIPSPTPTARAFSPDEPY